MSVRSAAINRGLVVAIVAVAAVVAGLLFWPAAPSQRPVSAAEDTQRGPAGAKPPEAPAADVALAAGPDAGEMIPAAAPEARTADGPWRCAPLPAATGGPRWRAARCARADDAPVRAVIVASSPSAPQRTVADRLADAVKRADGVDAFVTLSACSGAGPGSAADEAWRACLAAARPPAGRWLIVAAGEDAARLLGAAQRGRLPTTLVAVAPGASPPSPHRDLSSSALILASPTSSSWRAAERWKPLGARLVPTGTEVVDAGDLAGWLQALLAR